MKSLLGTPVPHVVYIYIYVWFSFKNIFGGLQGVVNICRKPQMGFSVLCMGLCRVERTGM